MRFGWSWGPPACIGEPAWPQISPPRSGRCRLRPCAGWRRFPMRIRRTLATLAALALLGSLTVIAPAGVGAAGTGALRTISVAGSSSITTGSFTGAPDIDEAPFVQDEFPGGEGADDGDAGPDPVDGSIALTTGH